MSGLIVRGEASDSTETFTFTIESHAAGGYILYIKFSGGDHSGLSGAGIWPSIERAKEIAKHTAARLLHGAKIHWQDGAQP